MIIWNDDDKRAILAHACIAKRFAPEMSDFACLQAGNHSLPLNRQRPLKATSQAPWFKEALTKALAKQDRAEAIEKVKEAAQAAKATEPAPAEPPPRPSEPLESFDFSEDEPEPQIEPQTLLAPNVREKLIDAFASIFSEALFRAIGSVAPLPQTAPAPIVISKPLGDDWRTRTDTPPVTAKSYPPDYIPPLKKKKIIVLIVGLRPAQTQPIEFDFGNIFELRFVGPDESKHALQIAAQRCDWAVMMLDACGHSHKQMVQSRCKNVIVQHGGATALKERLKSLQSELHVQVS